MSAAALRDGRFLLGTSWKMNKTRTEARHWIEAVHASGALDDMLGTFVVPPFTALGTARETLERIASGRAGASPAMALGAQTMSDAREGADTGEVSAAMLVDAGCGFVELGHSERRARHGEHDAAVARKVRLALDHGLTPLICLGDGTAERDAGVGIDAVLCQGAFALSRIEPHERARCLFAYEPVWAIGEGAEAADPERVGEMLAALRERHPGPSLLYGGSVSADNAGTFAGLDGLDGLFVGRAALEPDGFVAIARTVTAARLVRADRPAIHSDPSELP